MRLGFVVKSLARPELKSHDSRRWQNGPHLSVSLAYLRDIFAYLSSAGVTMYRMADDLAPYATHPELPHLHDQVRECAAELSEVGALAHASGLRLSFHPAQYVLLNSPDDELVSRSSGQLAVQAGILDGMGLGTEAVIVTHVGGVYGNPAASRERFVRNFATLPDAVRRRLVLENDDTRFSVSDVLWVHERTGIRIVFDYLHHRLHGSDGRSPHEALAACLDTWPPEARPKIHFSTPRTEWRVEGETDSRPKSLTQARWSYHSDYVNPFEFIDFCMLAGRLRDFDIMLEVRAKDLALLQLRKDLARFAPALAAQLEPADGTG